MELPVVPKIRRNKSWVDLPDAPEPSSVPQNQRELELSVEAMGPSKWSVVRTRVLDFGERDAGLIARFSGSGKLKRERELWELRGGSLKWKQE